MVGISGKVSSPIEATIIVPDREDVLISSDYRFDITPKYFFHEGDKILCGIAVDSYHSVALLHRKLLHHVLDHTIRVIVEALEVVSKVTHDVVALQDTPKELILVAEVTHVHFFVLAHILVYVPSIELVLKPVDRPSNVGRHGSIHAPVS